MRYRVIIAILTALFCVSAAYAAQDTPEVMVQGFYDTILHAQANNNDITAYPGAMSLIKPHASNRLATIIKKDEVCQKREEGVCHLNFDVLVYGQDYTLSDVHVSQLSTTDTKAVILAKFKNFDTQVQITFDFIKEGESWAIDDMEGSSSDGNWKLSQILTPSL